MTIHVLYTCIVLYYAICYMLYVYVYVLYIVCWGEGKLWPDTGHWTGLWLVHVVVNMLG